MLRPLRKHERMHFAAPRNHIIAMVKNMVGGGDEVDGDTPLMELVPQPSSCFDRMDLPTT